MLGKPSVRAGWLRPTTPLASWCRPCRLSSASAGQSLCCISIIQLHVYIYKYTLTLTGEERLQWTTNTLLYKNINLSHFIFERVMFIVCEKWVDKDGLLYWPKFFLSTIAALLSHLGLGCSTVGHWGPKSIDLQLVLTSASCLQLTQTVWAPGYIIFLHPPASAVLPLIYTGASLDWWLGRGSICNIYRLVPEACKSANADGAKSFYIRVSVHARTLH